MSAILHVAVDTDLFAGTAAQLWWEEYIATVDRHVLTFMFGEVWLHGRAAYLAFVALLTAHGVPAEAISMYVGYCDWAEWNAEAEAAGQTALGGLA